MLHLAALPCGRLRGLLYCMHLAFSSQGHRWELASWLLAAARDGLLAMGDKQDIVYVFIMNISSSCSIHIHDRSISDYLASVIFSLALRMFRTCHVMAVIPHFNYYINPCHDSPFPPRRKLNASWSFFSTRA